MTFSFVSNNHLYSKNICMQDSIQHIHLSFPDTFYWIQSLFQSIFCPLHQLWTCTRLIIHIWLNLGLSIQFRSFFLYPAQSILHVVHLKLNVFSASTGTFCPFQDEYVCMWCFLSTCVFIQRFVYAYHTFGSAVVNV